MSTAVIIVAAGRGSRAGGEIPKQWQMLAGKPVLCHTVAAFGDLPKILVIHPDDRARAEALFPGLWLVEGGADRATSVINALAQMEGCDVTRVLIHDGARPFVSQAVIERVLAALVQHDAAAPAVAVSDALWRGENGFVAATRDRAGLYRAQTPQGFRFPAILEAHRKHPGGALDDVEVARAAGIEVAIIEGDEDNIKLTYPADFARGERLLKGR